MLKESINEVIGTTPILCFICFINHTLVKCKLTKGKTKPTKIFPSFQWHLDYLAFHFILLGTLCQ